MLISKLTDTFYYQFAQLYEHKALKDINIKNNVKSNPFAQNSYVINYFTGTYEWNMRF